MRSLISDDGRQVKGLREHVGLSARITDEPAHTHTHTHTETDMHIVTPESLCIADNCPTSHVYEEGDFKSQP